MGTTHKNNLHVYNPESFDAAAILPTSLQKYQGEARYFVHLIYRQRIKDKRHRYDFVNLKFDYLAKVIDKRILKKLIAALLDAGVVESDGHYIKGRKAIGYRLAPWLRDTPHHKEAITKRSLVKRIRASYKRTEEEIRALPWRSWLFDNLRRVTIDHAGAVDYVFQQAQAALQSFRGQDSKRATRLRKEAKDRWLQCLFAIEAIRDGEFFFEPDDYGRIHTNVANLKSDLRQFLRVNEQQLIEIDIRNSQPLFFGILLIDWYRNSSQGLTILHNSTDAISPEKSMLITTPFFPSPPTVHYDFPFVNQLKLVENLALEDDLILYLELVQAGRLYEYLMDKAAIDDSERKEYKRKFFGRVFFNENRYHYPEQELFASLFPTVYKHVLRLKEKDYRHLSHLLQRYESKIIIDRLSQRLMVAKPACFIATIHDSVLTTPDNVETVLTVLQEELAACGVGATFKITGFGNEITSSHMCPSSSSA
jgi:hypothetical protein